MVIDTSAIIAWAQSEPEAEEIEDAIAGASLLVMSAFNLFETKTVLMRRFLGHGLAQIEMFIEDMGVRIFTFDDRQAMVALDAYRRFGKGSKHPAQLNLGDCTAYALARSLDLPLLFKGNDFIHTDIRPAIMFRKRP
jgi:ribonuclease VapC